jgi:hypothetical protein
VANPRSSRFEEDFPRAGIVDFNFFDLEGGIVGAHDGSLHRVSPLFGVGQEMASPTDS